ncbi:MAG TPA: hypothetical protein VGL83_00975 [Stellaceae bacterium]|jgi:hypothetical protein
MTEAIGWEFPVDNADQWRGFNDAGIEHFRGSLSGSLAREILQNSLDAASARPVVVSFKYREVFVTEIPGVDQLRAALSQCLTDAKAVEGKKAVDFFTTAQKVLNAKQIAVLSISEKNTKGMRGPCKNGTPYFAYVKATGQSKKGDGLSDTDLGSYGIGKFAPFTVSDLRTIFLSTVFRDGNTYRQYAQGKALLMSHRDAAGHTRQNIGYWGVTENCMPIEGGNPSLPRWLMRAPKQSDIQDSVGTTLHILGFRAADGWEKSLVASVLENFFGAIWKGALVVEVNSLSISKESIFELFNDKTIHDSVIGSKGQPEGFDNAKSYLSTLAATEEVFIEDQENRELGNCQIRIILGEQFPKRVAVLRNGMFITDEMDRLKRFGDFKEFAAVIECHSKKGNELLRDMEPPKHNDFEPDRLSPDDQPKGQRAIAELGRWAREMLMRHARDVVSEVSDVRELADYFADDGEEDDGEKGEEINPVGKIQIRAQPLKRRSVVTEDSDDEGTDGGSEGDGNGSGGGKGKGKGKGNNGKVAAKSLPLNNVRSIVLSAKKRRLAATPEFSGIMELTVFEAGADTDRRLNVVKSSGGNVRKGAIRNLKGKRGARFTLDIELDAPFQGAMKVAAHEVR